MLKLIQGSLPRARLFPPIVAANYRGAYNASMFLSVQNISETVKEVLSGYDILEAYLFGSFARGDASADSDIDLRLLCGSSMNYGTLAEIEELLESQFGRSVEIITNPPEHMRPAFRERIQKDEVLLYAAA